MQINESKTKWFVQNLQIFLYGRETTTVLSKRAKIVVSAWANIGVPNESDSILKSTTSCLEWHKQIFFKVWLFTRIHTEITPNTKSKFEKTYTRCVIFTHHQTGVASI